MEKITVTGPVGSLQAVLHRAKLPSSDFLIVCHPHPLYAGTMDNKVVTTIAKSYLDAGINVVRFNYRGVGESEGEYGDIHGEVDDALSVYKWLNQNYEVKRLFLAGFSFGCYIAAKSALEVVKKQVEVPYILMVAPSVEHSPFELAQPLAAPCTVIMGKEDELVPYELVIDWVGTQANEIEVVTFADTGHFFHGQLINLKSAIKSALKPYI